MTGFSEVDRRHMARALALAARGRGSTWPNPRVGCVIAQGERVVGEGWHRRAGGPHAEVFALAQAGGAARGATAYVTLEPCSHVGRTPACHLALIVAGIARVVVAHEDPFERVNGRGIAGLQAAGIRVERGLLAEAAAELNLGFLSSMRRARPWLRLCLSLDADGRMGRAAWADLSEPRADLQQWRGRSAAILVGSGSVLADDPELGVLPATAEALPPVRVVLDGRARVPAGARVFDRSAPTLHVLGERPGTFVEHGHECLVLGEAGTPIPLPALLCELSRRGLHEVQAETGPRLSKALLQAELVDELLIYLAAPAAAGAQAPTRLPASATPGPGFRVHEVQPVGRSLRLCLRLRRAQGSAAS